jgi:hypothetical protein
MVKKIIIRLGLLMLIFIASNWVYKLFFFEADLQKHADFIETIRQLDPNTEILYLGESSNFTTRCDDSLRQSISDFLKQWYPTLVVNDLTHAAVHAGMYYRYLQNLPPQNAIKTVVVTLNLRSFNANWIYSDLETPLQKSIVLFKPYPPLVNRFLLSFKAYDVKTTKEREQQFKREWKKHHFSVPFVLPYKNVIEWDKAVFHNGVLYSNGNKNWELTALACHYIKTYAFQITDNNPRIRDFDKIVALAKKQGWNLVFNLMAENTQKAEQMVGPELVWFIRQNRDYLVNRYQKMGVLVVDNLELVPDREYIDQNWTTEHYAQTGRQQIAANLADSLQKFYKQAYTPITSPAHTPMLFFTNCETSGQWHQGQTLTTEQAFSGQRSSKTDNTNPYSITLSLPVAIMPNDFLNRVSVSFMCLNPQNTSNARVVFQTPGFENPLPNTFQINTIDNGQWQKVTCEFLIPEAIHRASELKLFVHNPSPEPIFIDDITIQWH